MPIKPDIRKYPAHSTKRNVPKVERVVSVKPKKVGNMIVCDGVKIGRLQEGKLHIFDKDKRRSEERGSNEVVVDPADLQDFCEDCEMDEARERIKIKSKGKINPICGHLEDCVCSGIMINTENDIE